MAKVKGYFNTTNGVFLGPMTATSETGVAHTPRYVEGVCFGEFDTDTEEFIPLTNPVMIPKGTIVEFDEQINANGQNEMHVTGFQEDKGADLVRKGSVKGFKLQPTNVYTGDEKGNPLTPGSFQLSAKEQKEKQISEKPKQSNFKEAKHPTKLKVDNIPEINWDELF